MKEFLLRHPYLVCGLGQIQHQKRLRGAILLLAFLDCLGIGSFFLLGVDHPFGLPISLLCFLLAGLLWFYSYIDYLELIPTSQRETHPKGTDFYEEGRISYLRGELSEARAYFQKALKRNRDDADALYQLARVHFDLGETRKARRLFTQYTKTDSSRKWQREVEEYLEGLQ